MELPHFVRHTFYTLGFHDTDGEASKAGDIFWAVTGAYPTSVFIIIPVDDVVTAIFDAPVASVCFEHLLGVGLLWRLAGDPVDLQS